MNKPRYYTETKTLERACQYIYISHKTKDNNMKDKRVAIEQSEYNELLELFTMKHGDEAKERLDSKYRVKGVKGGIAQLFQKQFPDHVFTRAIESHGSTQQEFTCRESGQKYVLRINGAKVVEIN